jgi:hypothetical protein
MTLFRFVTSRNSEKSRRYGEAGDKLIPTLTPGSVGFFLNLLLYTEDGEGYGPPKRLFLSELFGVTDQKTVFSVVADIRSQNPLEVEVKFT